MARQTTYQYRPTDSPLTVANQFGVSPQQLLAANPGGVPFSPGQTIQIPYQYRPIQYGPTAPPITNPTPSLLGSTGPAGPTPTIQYGQPIGPQPAPTTPVQTVGQVDPRRGRGFATPTYNGATDDSWYRPTQAATSTQAQPATVGGFSVATGQTLGTGDFYGYVRDPATGRDVRVIKNSSTSNFLNEMRWDPQRRRYISIRQWLKQSRRGGGGRRRKGGDGGGETPPEQDHTLTNSFINFNVSAG